MSLKNQKDANYDPKDDANYDLQDEPTYDAHITPAEVGARMDREKENFKQLPDPEESLDTTGGYTVDREGLINNYAVEPEMYVDVPGDLREKEEALEAERAQELKGMNEEGGGKGKGPGVI